MFAGERPLMESLKLGVSSRTARKTEGEWIRFKRGKVEWTVEMKKIILKVERLEKDKPLIFEEITE